MEGGASGFVIGAKCAEIQSRQLFIAKRTWRCNSTNKDKAAQEVPQKLGRQKGSPSNLLSSIKSNKNPQGVNLAEFI